MNCLDTGLERTDNSSHAHCKTDTNITDLKHTLNYNNSNVII